MHQNINALTIAGSDSCAGAGIQADLKTFAAFGVYGLSAITAVTAQNTQGVQQILPLSSEIVAAQIRSVATDIPIAAVKTGMLVDTKIVKVVIKAIEENNFTNLVIDPVMAATSGKALLSSEGRTLLKEYLFPHARVITPNLAEAEILCGERIDSIAAMKDATVILQQTGCQWVVIKGGHLAANHQAIDIAYNGKDFFTLNSERWKCGETHGTGCTFAAAIAAGLGKGQPVLQALQAAKNYISAAIKHGLRPGKGSQVPNHFVEG